MSAQIPRVALRQIASRRLFSAYAPRRQAHASAADELQALLRRTDHQSADYAKMIKERATTFAIYSVGMSTVLGWPLAAKWMLDGRI